MGSTQSVQVAQDSEEEEEEEEDEDEEGDENGEPDRRREAGNHLVKKVLEQEPEMLPCYASTSPLSPQLSSLGTPRLGQSIKVWDPYNVLGPPPPLPPPPPPPPGMVESEVFLISHGECQLNLRPDLVGGRCPEATLTPNGKRQARALAVFLISQGVRFNVVYSSPLDRTLSMALSVCQVSSSALFSALEGTWLSFSFLFFSSLTHLSYIAFLQKPFSTMYINFLTSLWSLKSYLVLCFNHA